MQISDPNTSDPLHSSCTPASDRRPGACRGADVTEPVHGNAADGRQEYLEVGPGHELGIHSARFLEQHPPEIGFLDPEALRDPRQVPHRLDCNLRHPRLARVGQHFAVRLEAAGIDRAPDLRHREARPGDRDGGPDVEPGLDLAREHFADHVPPGIEGDDPTGVEPFGIRPDRLRGGRYP